MSEPGEAQNSPESSKKDRVLKCRVTQAEDLTIRELARLAGMTVSEFMITSAIHGRPSEITRIDPALDRHLAAVGNNLNQIARACNSRAAGGEHIDLLNVLMELQTITKGCAAYAPKI